MTNKSIYVKIMENSMDIIVGIVSKWTIRSKTTSIQLIVKYLFREEN